MTPTLEQHEVSLENAHLFLEWLKNRGGILVWQSINLANPGMTWSTPAECNGIPTEKPTWQAANEPIRRITNASEVSVVTTKEVKRFHVALRMGSQGMTMKCTDASSERIRKAIDKAGEGASYLFDYDTQEAVILAPTGSIPLPQWEAQK